MALAQRESPAFVPDYDDWNPPSEMYELLAEVKYTRDRVEIVHAFYAATHRGQGPFASEIARVLGIAKQNVERRMLELIAEGRARKLHGKFILIAGNYTHPKVGALLDA